jgi:hypothetical protein
MDNILHNLIYSFFDEVIAHQDNYPTKLSLLLYCYFQMFYNIGSLFNTKTPITADRVIFPNWYNELYKQLSFNTIGCNRLDLLHNLLYYGHNGFLSALYKDFDKNKYKITDFGINDIRIVTKLQSQFFNWGAEHLLGKNTELKTKSNIKINSTGMPADISGTLDFVPTNPNKWTNLIVPNGSFSENDIPIIDINASTTYNIQNFIENEWGNNRGFSIYPVKEEILDLSAKISKSWNEGYQQQSNILLAIYENLDERKKIISELFSGESKTNISISGFWVIIAMMLSKKNNQSIENDITMFFIIGAGMYDAGIATWTYKSKFESPRPINIIRYFLKEKQLISWNPQMKPSIMGQYWLPYQNLTYVSPSHPETISSHTMFSVVSGRLLEWWFNSSNLYNPFKLFSISNPQLISSCLNSQYKTFSCGEFCIKRGSSQIEPDVTPSQTILLKYNTIKELYDDIALSRVYGGVNWMKTIENSNELACWVSDKVRNKFESIFKIRSPY